MENVYQTGKPPVNDGGGLYDNEGLIETLVVDCNELPKMLINGQFIKFSATLVQMVQKLANLKEGIKNDMASKDKIIAELTETNNDLAEQVYGIPVDRGGEDA